MSNVDKKTDQPITVTQKGMYDKSQIYSSPLINPTPECLAALQEMAKRLGLSINHKN